MKGIAILALALSLAVLALSRLDAHRQDTRIRAIEEATAQIRVQLPVKPRVADLELQSKCAEGARSAYGASWSHSKIASYTNHYNLALGECFVSVHEVEPSKTGSSVSISLFDAFEQTQYGTYLWISSKDKRYWEVKPYECDVTLPSGAKQTCASDEEFGALVKVYMENP